MELLDHFPPATAEELERVASTPTAPTLAPWTVAFDGRLTPPPGSLDQHLLALAAAAGGSAAEQFSMRWLRSTAVADKDLDWVPDAWMRLSLSTSPAIRQEAIGRLSREQGRGRADEILATRVAAESTWALRLLAIEGLFDAAVAGEELVQASLDNHPQVRAAAASRLAEVPGHDALNRLEVMLRGDPDNKVRRAARKALRGRQVAGL